MRTTGGILKRDAGLFYRGEGGLLPQADTSGVSEGICW